MNLRRNRLRIALLSVSVACTAIGCTSLTGSLPGIGGLTASKDKVASVSDRAASASETLNVSNPRATEIRFDGQEHLLGGANCQCIPADQLRQQVADLLADKKLRSATALVRLHPRSAQQLMVQDLRVDLSGLDFVAATLDRGREGSTWTDHRTACKSSSGAAERFQADSQQLVVDTNSDEPIEPSQARLSDAAAKLASVPLSIEARRLTAMSLVARKRTDEAITILVGAAESATQSGLPQMSSDLWMMACEASLQIEQVDQARSCWKAGVANQLASIRMRPNDQSLPPIDTVFWEQADRLIHPEDSFPVEISLAFSAWYSRMGIGSDGATSVAGTIQPRVALWSSIAEFQLVTGQPHLATLSVKRAEVDADESMKPWLQIASARSLAAQKQSSLATTILTGLINHERPTVRAASLAALGSIKIQTGAFEQGSGFLIGALNMSEANNWPGQIAAKADLANVRLIVGKLDDALPALHSVQNEMMIAGRWQSLCQSLENEAAILDAEKQHENARLIRERILSIEQG